MMTIGATVVAMRGTLKRRSKNTAKSPIVRAPKKAAEASVHPVSIKTSRRSLATSAEQPTASTVRGALSNVIAKAHAAIKLAAARSTSLKWYASSTGGCRDMSTPATPTTMVRPKATASRIIMPCAKRLIAARVWYCNRSNSAAINGNPGTKNSTDAMKPAG